MANNTNTLRKPKKKRTGIHSKNKSRLKKSVNYNKPYKGQGK